MPALIENTIADLISQSDNIARQVRLENWDAVKHLTEERQLAFENFFRRPIKTEYAKSVEQMIRKILEIDRTVVEFIELEKQNTLNKFANIKSNTKANKAYQNIATLHFG